MERAARLLRFYNNHCLAERNDNFVPFHCPISPPYRVPGKLAYDKCALPIPERCNAFLNAETIDAFRQNDNSLSPGCKRGLMRGHVNARRISGNNGYASGAKLGRTIGRDL